MAKTRAAPPTTAPRRSGRVANENAAAGPSALPVGDANRITKTTATPKPTIECTTCSRTLAASAFFKRLPTKTCAHETHVCKACLKTWIDAQLESTTFDQLRCPECPERMDNKQVKAFATKETYAKYDHLERRAFQDKTPGWRWCLAANCRAGQVHEALLETTDGGKGGDEVRKGKEATEKKKKGKKQKITPTDDPNICTCTTCGAKACVSCDRPYHDGETCDEYQTRLERQQGEEEAASLLQIAKACKPCPKCGKKIEKDGGCDQVRCTQCSESFCWLCSTSYKVINKQGHAQSCIYAKADRFDPHAAPNAPGNAVGWMN